MRATHDLIVAHPEARATHLVRPLRSGLVAAYAALGREDERARFEALLRAG